MHNVRYVYWQDGGFWLGYLEEFPEYVTQGMTFEELRDNLTDLFKDLSSGEIPCVRKVGELQVA